ncbi:hypothetical protein [Streptomyces uncialis]|uniref:hypothetical protein n=1 Tax=Streptomyces uncialis TaxID=1048205 RepID=UPI001160FB5C|nr:hypothetical protein [Streptomyces uncialis]
MVWRIEDFWARHVSHRELHRRLDNLRLLYRAEELSEQEIAESAERSLQRIRDSWAAQREQESGD